MKNSMNVFFVIINPSLVIADLIGNFFFFAYLLFVYAFGIAGQAGNDKKRSNNKIGLTHNLQ